MKVIYVVTQYLSYKDGSRSQKILLKAFKNEFEAKRMADSLCCSFDYYDVVVSYEVVELL